MRPPGGRDSGRRFLIYAGAGLVVIWVVLVVLFLEWRAEHRAIVAYGARTVVPAVDPLMSKVPPGVSPEEWRAVVADTRAMLAAVTASGLLDRPAMDALRAELDARVARTRPTTALAELSQLWDEMEARAGPILTRGTERPPFPPKRPKRLVHAKTEAKSQLPPRRAR